MKCSQSRMTLHSSQKLGGSSLTLCMCHGKDLHQRFIWTVTDRLTEDSEVHDFKTDQVTPFLQKYPKNCLFSNLSVLLGSRRSSQTSRQLLKMHNNTNFLVKPIKLYLSRTGGSVVVWFQLLKEWYIFVSSLVLCRANQHWHVFPGLSI